MKKWMAFLFVLASEATQAFAQAPQSSLLWEISGKGLTAPSYLFGTFHILCKSDFAISETLQNKIKNTKQFYGELKMDDAGMQMELAMKMIMKDKTLESLMGATDFQKASEAFEKITHMPLSRFNNFKPFMSQSLLAINMISCAEQIQQETDFVQIATDNHLPVFGLETVEAQLNAIDKIPLDSQVNDLKQTLLNFDSAKLEMRKMVSVYKKGNIDSVYEFIAKNTGSSFEKDMVITRNESWMPVIQKAMNEKATFFAVGAGHLGGTSGVINLLRKQGYKVTPVTF